MKLTNFLKQATALFVFNSCTPALHLHVGDHFAMPYVASSFSGSVDWNKLSEGQKIVVQRCGDPRRDYSDMERIKPLFDRLIVDAEAKSNAVLLKDAVVTVKESKCMQLQAIPLVRQ